MRYLPQDERQVPLAVKYETKEIWPKAKEIFGVCSTGAAIIVALHDNALIGNLETSYSRSCAYYNSRNNHPLLSFRRVVRNIDWLDRDGWIDNFKQCQGGRGWQSFMKATPDLVAVVSGLLHGLHLPIEQPRSPIVLRVDGRPIDCPSSRQTRAMERDVMAINEALRATRIVSANGANLAAPVARIFNDTFNRGGRFYGMGGSWQNIPADERANILMDDTPVAELDYGALHPSLLYAEIGTVPPANCYTIGNWPRPLVKLALLVLINAKNKIAALGAIEHSAEMAALGLDCPKTRRQFANKLIDDIKDLHRPIAKFFHTDAGARLMRVDSDLASSVMGGLRKKGIVALPVHDSFVVQAPQLPFLEETMRDCAAEIGLPAISVS